MIEDPFDPRRQEFINGRIVTSPFVETKGPDPRRPISGRRPWLRRIIIIGSALATFATLGWLGHRDAQSLDTTNENAVPNKQEQVIKNPTTTKPTLPASEKTDN